MSYLTDQVDRRRDLRTAFPWARSVVCLGLQYDTPGPYSVDSPEGGWISRYAWGEDYHDVMGAMLKSYLAKLQGAFGPFEARSYVDTGPIVERAYAAQAGLGAWGKNTCLLHPEHGSWFFLGEVVTGLALDVDSPRPDMCGTCRACLDACPTGALPEPYVLDATRCISYLTIEIKGEIPAPQREGLSRHVFGCDICQDVCPWNRKRRETGPAAFLPREGNEGPDLVALAGLGEEGFRTRFRRSPLRRAKRRGLLRNVAVALGNTGTGDGARSALERLAQDGDPLVREHALWALRRLSDRS
jgi:epoxyqueuosine reductase